MKSTKVNKATGAVICPKCGAADFTPRRSIKGRIGMGLLAPRRLKCRGCGAMLKAS